MNKPENGNLYLDGKLLYQDMPFALLQQKAKELMRKENIQKHRIKLKYFWKK